MTEQEFEDEYDVVVDVLTERIHILSKMNKKDLNSDMVNIMTQIRWEQIFELENAIKHHLERKKKEKNNG
jgi:hypothetical protein